LTFLKPNYEILAFLTHLGFLENKTGQKKSGVFQAERLVSRKTLSELYIHYKFPLTRIYDHAGCKEYCEDFTVALKMIDVFNKKQMYDSAITGKENASKD